MNGRLRPYLDYSWTNFPWHSNCLSTDPSYIHLSEKVTPFDTNFS